MSIDKPRIEAAVRELLIGIGEDPDREGLQGTPARVARACEEIFGGLSDDPRPDRQFNRSFKGKDADTSRDGAPTFR